MWARSSTISSPHRAFQHARYAQGAAHRAPDQGFVLYSDMGRILCSITADTAGWHDPLGGCSNRAMLAARYGEASFQDHRNNCYQNGRDSFLIELGNGDWVPGISSRT